METMKLAWLVLVASLGVVHSDLPDLECPEDCDCHYFRINWVTDCSDSNLTSIPSVNEGLSLEVYNLKLDGNQLKSITPPFPANIKIRELHLDENQLTFISRDDFASLKYLLEIDLSYNRITHLDPDAFSENQGLLSLQLRKNPLETIAEGPFLISRTLHYLDMSDCGLTHLSRAFFTDLTALSSLDLSGNPIRVLKPEILDPLTSLEVLKLNRANLTFIEKDAFGNLGNLKSLELSENQLKSDVDWMYILGGLRRLERLDLRRSGISYLPGEVFENNTWLTALLLAYNDLHELDLAKTLGQSLRHLTYLDLSYCNLQGPLSEDSFANDTNIKTLYLAGNHLSAAGLAQALAPLTRLTKLSLRNCSLTRLPANTFHRFTRLKELDISYNPLNDAFVELLSPLESLQILDMGYSDLGHISKTTFAKMTRLKRLVLSGNPLTSLESGLFQNLTHLEDLELNHCGLSRLNATVFFEDHTYPDLVELHLAGNPLKVPSEGSFIPVQLNRLKNLDLRSCNLTSIPSGVLAPFGNITHLTLASNKLKSVEFLKQLPNLEFVDLSANNLSKISPDDFNKNKKLHEIRLVGNPWVCACNLHDLWYWASVEKGDIGLLVGSTASKEDELKRKKSLMCEVDKQHPMKRTPRVDSQWMTWARYVKDSSCNTTSKKPTKLQSRKLRAVPVDEPHESDSQAWRWLPIASIGSVVVILLGLTFRLVNSRKVPRQSPPCSDVEDSSSATQYRQTSQSLRKLSKLASTSQPSKS